MVLLFLLLSVLYVGDSLTCSRDNIVVEGDRICSYYVADSILALQEVGQYDIIVIEVGIHAARGGDRLYTDNLPLFRRRYGQLLDEAYQHAPVVVAVNIPWNPWWQSPKLDLALALNQVIAQESAARQVRMVDAWSIVRECGARCISADLFHPSAFGYARLKVHIMPVYSRAQTTYMH
jgi:hypothetical protein